MAIHAHSTRTPLLPPIDLASPLLGQGPGRQLGPVTLALAVMAAADPDKPAPPAKTPLAIITTDGVAIAIAAGCGACWLVPAALWIGGLI